MSSNISSLSSSSLAISESSSFVSSAPIFSGIAPSSKTSSRSIVSSEVKASWSILISFPLSNDLASDYVLETIKDIVAWTSGCNLIAKLWIPKVLMGLSNLIWFFSTIKPLSLNEFLISLLLTEP